jgi:eukaryotic-like serine/threonine-protein kinase
MLPPEPERILGGRYRLQQVIGRGGMATMWLDEDTLLARRVAVKTLHPELSANEALRIRFRHEAVSSASIEDARIVGVYDTGDDDGVAYIVMEYVEGRDVRRLLDAEGPLPVDEAVRIAADVARALDRAHRSGIIHRDIKPANVLVAADGRVKVTDFGISKASQFDHDLTTTGQILGTARYLAPEQVNGDPVDGRADQYATGLLLYEMLTGRLPFRGDTEVAVALARLTTEPQPLPPGTPADVAAVVDRCMAIDPAQRYPDAGALAAALERVDDQDVTAGHELTGVLPSVPTPPRPSPVPVTPRPRRGRGCVAVLLVVALLVGGGAGAYLLLRNQSSSKVAASGAPVTLVAAKDYDPVADGGDGIEDPSHVGLAIDHNLLTAWTTESYSSRNLGGGKPGVGIYVTLAKPASIGHVSVDTFETDWNGQVYAAAAPPSQFSGWGKPLATGDHLQRHTDFRVHPSGPVGVVLVWITNLPPPSGHCFMTTGSCLNVAEIQVR